MTFFFLVINSDFHIFTLLLIKNPAQQLIPYFFSKNHLLFSKKNTQKDVFSGEIWKTPEIQYNTISFIEDDKNKDREVSADTAATETYYMMGINKI